MTENKQITIYELLSLLKSGWVTTDEDGEWSWFEEKPIKGRACWLPRRSNQNWCLLNISFNIKPFDGDWKDSLMRCGK